MGFSLGGNVLLKYLGERGGDAVPLAAAAVSVPFDLAAGSAELDTRPMGRVYQSVLLRSLRGKVRAKEGPLAGACDARAALAARSFRDFDDAATSRLHGFRDVDDYYASSSSAGFLAGIRVPTLLVHSADDPFLPAAAIPRETVAANPCLQEAFTDRGGHVGFVGGPPWAPRFWAEEEAARFLASHLGAGRG